MPVSEASLTLVPLSMPVLLVAPSRSETIVTVFRLISVYRYHLTS